MACDYFCICLSTFIGINMCRCWRMHRKLWKMWMLLTVQTGIAFCNGDSKKQGRIALVMWPKAGLHSCLPFTAILCWCPSAFLEENRGRWFPQTCKRCTVCHWKQHINEQIKGWVLQMAFKQKWLFETNKWSLWGWLLRGLGWVGLTVRVGN